MKQIQLPIPEPSEKWSATLKEEREHSRRSLDRFAEITNYMAQLRRLSPHMFRSFKKGSRIYAVVLKSSRSNQHHVVKFLSPIVNDKGELLILNVSHVFVHVLKLKKDPHTNAAEIETTGVDGIAGAFYTIQQLGYAIHGDTFAFIEQSL